MPMRFGYATGRGPTYPKGNKLPKASQQNFNGDEKTPRRNKQRMKSKKS